MYKNIERFRLCSLYYRSTMSISLDFAADFNSPVKRTFFGTELYILKVQINVFPYFPLGLHIPT